VAHAKTHRASVPTPPRPRPRRAHWQALIEACRRSGLSQAEFCRRRGLRPGTLAFWKHTLARAGAAARPGARRARPAAPTFVPVRVIAPPAPPPSVGAAPATSGEIDIVLSRDRHVRVRGPVDVAWLGQVVRTLETLGC